MFGKVHDLNMAQRKKHARVLVPCFFFISNIKKKVDHAFKKPSEQDHRNQIKIQTPNLEKVWLLSPHPPHPPFFFLSLWQIFQLRSNFEGLSRYLMLLHHFCRPHCAIVWWSVAAVVPLCYLAVFQSLKQEKLRRARQQSSVSLRHKIGCKPGSC